MPYDDYEIVKPINSKPVNFSSNLNGENEISLIAKKFKSEDALEFLLTSKRIYETVNPDSEHSKAKLAIINAEIENIRNKQNS
jgi:hypothetical protein